MKKQPSPRPVADKPTLKSQVIAAFSNESPDCDVKSFFGRDGRFALLSDASDASDRSKEVYVEFPTNRPLRSPLEIYVGRRRIVAGIWRADLWANEQKLDATGPWRTLCEEIDENGAFLERSLSLTGGRAFSRRLFVAYNEGLFLNVDVLHGSDSERAAVEHGLGSNAPLLRIRSAFPLDSTDAFATQTEAPSEVAFHDVDSRSLAFARAFLLEAYENPSDERDGTLAVKTTYGGILAAEARRRGGSLCVATLFDWNASRATRAVRIGKATVGENLRAVDENSALGRQIQLGRERYVLYVSTSRRPAIRSILSRNLLSDFMFGKFLVGRGVEPLVDVEVPDGF
ncbi:MAG: hypothetical protein IKU86_02755 [Thermoguttaceae bacterium]|nr:hypothetical protein [Thermoguttaceae bacterium]